MDTEGRDGRSRPSAFPIPTTHITALELRESPIPDARELVRYGYAHPLAPEMILKEFTNQGDHRRLIERRELGLERRALEAAVRSERLGVFCGLVIALVGFGCATFLVSTGHAVAGTVIFGLDVGALVSAFILGRSQRPGPMERHHQASGRSPAGTPTDRRDAA